MQAELLGDAIGRCVVRTVGPCGDSHKRWSYCAIGKVPGVVVKIKAVYCFHKLLFIYQGNPLELQGEGVGLG